MAHTIERLRDTDGSIVPYNPKAKCFYVVVDLVRRICLFCETEADIDAAIARLNEQLEEEDRRREEEERTRPKRYSKLRLYAALSKAGFWEPLVVWLSGQEVGGVNAWTAFQLAQDLTSDHPLFATYLAAAQSALGVDEETVAAVLAAAELRDGE